MAALFVIPARGGSKGVPKKNIRKLNGKPLIEYTLEVARSLTDDGNICVSTDSLEIKDVVEKTGLKVPFLRPSELATDEASTEGVIRHAIGFFQSAGKSFDTVVLLQPTSPFRRLLHLKEALSAYERYKPDMVVSVRETKSNPYYTLMEENEQGYLVKSKTGNFIRRQDCPVIYELNGAIYIFPVGKFLQGGFASLVNRMKYVMDEPSSLDVDTEFDWKIAELMASEFFK